MRQLLERRCADLKQRGACHANRATGISARNRRLMADSGATSSLHARTRLALA